MTPSNVIEFLLWFMCLWLCAVQICMGKWHLYASMPTVAVL
uniref:Uncharacterized protein n=1 Tax=Arundo donax TaxID=35708 RepID=A0A0A9BGX1_ARUDO